MQDELTLFRKMQEGDWNAFNSFFESYSERLYLYALGFVGNRAEAEDIVQDTFIYLWVNRAKISHSGSIYAYLSRSVKNSCIDRKLHEEVKQRYQREMMASGEEVSEDSESFEELYERLQIVMCRGIELQGRGRTIGRVREYREDTGQGRLQEN